MGVVLGQTLGQITPSVINQFLFIFTWGIPLKQKVVAVKIPEWKFKANIARNATFEGRLGSKFCPIWVKNGKKLTIFKNFTLVSQS